MGFNTIVTLASRICIKRTNSDCEVQYTRESKVAAYFYSVGQGTGMTDMIGKYGGTAGIGCAYQAPPGAGATYADQKSDSGCGETEVRVYYYID
mgnify:CR=1 FL=1